MVCCTESLKLGYDWENYKAYTSSPPPPSSAMAILKRPIVFRVIVRQVLNNKNRASIYKDSRVSSLTFSNYCFDMNFPLFYYRIPVQSARQWKCGFLGSKQRCP